MFSSEKWDPLARAFLAACNLWSASMARVGASSFMTVAAWRFISWAMPVVSTAQIRS
jgi:hypothetical protein